MNIVPHRLGRGMVYNSNCVPMPAGPASLLHLPWTMEVVVQAHALWAHPSDDVPQDTAWVVLCEALVSYMETCETPASVATSVATAARERLTLTTRVVMNVIRNGCHHPSDEPATTADYSCVSDVEQKALSHCVRWLKSALRSPVVQAEACTLANVASALRVVQSVVARAPTPFNALDACNALKAVNNMLHVAPRLRKAFVDTPAVLDIFLRLLEVSSPCPASFLTVLFQVAQRWSVDNAAFAAALVDVHSGGAVRARRMVSVLAHVLQPVFQACTTDTGNPPVASGSPRFVLACTLLDLFFAVAGGPSLIPPSGVVEEVMREPMSQLAVVLVKVCRVQRWPLAWCHRVSYVTVMCAFVAFRPGVAVCLVQVLLLPLTPASVELKDKVLRVLTHVPDSFAGLLASNGALVPVLDMLEDHSAALVRGESERTEQVLVEIMVLHRVCEHSDRGRRQILARVVPQVRMLCVVCVCCMPCTLFDRLLSMPLGIAIALPGPFPGY